MPLQKNRVESKENIISNKFLKEELKGTKICISCEREIDIEDEYCDCCDRAQPKTEYEDFEEFE